MPCQTCGHPLLVFHPKEDLRCLHCLNLDQPDTDELNESISHTRRIISDERMDILLKEYSRDHLLLYFIERLNKTTHQLYQERRMKQKAVVNRQT